MSLNKFWEFDSTNRLLGCRVFVNLNTNMCLRTCCILLWLLKSHEINNWTSICLPVPMCYYQPGFISFVRDFISGRITINTPFKKSGGVSCRRLLSQRNGNFPPAISTAFISACASYFLSCPPQLASCFAIPTVPPSLLSSPHWKDTLWRQHPVCQQSPKNFLTDTPTMKIANNRYLKIVFCIQEGCRGRQPRYMFWKDVYGVLSGNTGRFNPSVHSEHVIPKSTWLFGLSNSCIGSHTG